MAYAGNPDAFLAGIIAKAKAALADGVDLMLAVAGAGAVSSLLEVVRSWFPEQTKDIADETLAAAIGFALFYFGDRLHRRLAPFGLGVFIAGVGAWASAWVSGIILMLKKAGAA